MNNDLWIWTSDWHLTSSDAETGTLGETLPSQAVAVVEHFKGLQAAGMIDTGDCKDHYGSSTGDEHDNYIAYVRANAPWATVNAGVNATQPILPGNHDEVEDYGTPGSVTNFSIWDSKFWSAPYHWTCDWVAPRIRFIAFHAYIVHGGTFSGYFQMDASERTWLAAELAALPAGWSAIICSHPPALGTFGNQVHATLGGVELLAILTTYNDRISAYLNGHRHENMNTAVQNSITHFNGGAVSYTLANSFGGFMLIEYLRETRQLKFHYRYGPPTLYGAVKSTVYTPVTINITSLPGSSLVTHNHIKLVPGTGLSY